MIQATKRAMREARTHAIDAQIAAQRQEIEQLRQEIEQLRHERAEWHRIVPLIIDATISTESCQCRSCKAIDEACALIEAVRKKQ